MARHYERHGFSKHPLYNRYLHMLGRCYNEKHCRYATYGGRGIEVCPEWRADFATFLADVGNPPTLLHTIDRIDVSGNYEPSNIRWATMADQQRNRRNNIRVTFGDRTMVLKDWCTELGLPYMTVKCRLVAGWTPEASVYYAPRMTTEKLREKCAQAWAVCFPNGEGDCYLR